MLIVCCGMQRSFSTLLYQIVGELLHWENGLGVNYEHYHHEIDVSQGLHFIKTHDKERDILDVEKKYIFSYRDIRDVFASYHSSHQYFGPKIAVVSPAIIQKMLENSDYFTRKQGTLSFKYEDFLGKEQEIIKAISEFICINANIEHIFDKVNFRHQKEICDHLKYPTPLTMHVPYHLSDGRIGKYEEFLTPFEIEFINASCYDWLINNGYTVRNRSSVDDVLTRYNALVTQQESSLYDLFGKNWERVYNLPCNSGFRSLFPQPAVIRPGYVIFFKEFDHAT